MLVDMLVVSRRVLTGDQDDRSVEHVPIWPSWVQRGASTYHQAWQSLVFNHITPLSTLLWLI